MVILEDIKILGVEVEGKSPKPTSWRLEKEERESIIILTHGGT